jgi:hypothetical protein
VTSHRRAVVDGNRSIDAPVDAPATSVIAAALAEVEERLKLFDPQLEGLRDYERLNIQPATMEAVKAAIKAYEERIRLLHELENALKGLLADGSPDLPIFEVDAAVLSDLQENAATIAAALARFRSAGAAGSLELTAGAIEPK